MDKVTINWSQTNWDEIRRREDTKFYAFTRGNNLLYIGIAHRQNIADEVVQTRRRLGIKKQGVSVWVGDIDKSESTYNRITEQIVLATECLMIYMNEPIHNTQCRKNYNHRKGFRVVSRGLSLLHHRISCDVKGTFMKR